MAVSSEALTWALRVRHPSGETRTYQGRFGPGSSLSLLRETISSDFALGSTAYKLVFGHPPTSIPPDGAATLREIGLGNAEVIQIVLAEVEKKVHPKRKPTSSAKRRKQDVSSDDEDEIEFAEEDSEEERPKAATRPRTTNSKGKPKAASGGGSQPRTFGARIATLHQPRGAKKLKSKEEVGEKLVASFAPGESRDSVSKLFRRLTRGEVVRQYEIAAANAKLNAVLRNQYEITPLAVSGHRLIDGAPTEVTLKVKYKKGPRSWAEETVQGLSEDLLRESIRSVLHTQVHPDDVLSHPREGLRPIALPLISKRVFWTLIHWHGGGTDCIERGLRQLLPLESWDFLNVRTRRESERARQWRETENVLDALERGVTLVLAEDEVENELMDVVGSREDRKRLLDAGVDTLLKLAGLDPGALNGLATEDYVNEARAISLASFMEDILVDASEETRAKLQELDIKTPADVARLRIPGRTEMIVEETKLDLAVVEKWKRTAEQQCRENAWLAGIRTRG